MVSTHAGHCWRSRGELIRDVLLWTPTHGHAKAGRPARTYIQQLCEDTGCCPEDLPRAMNDREEWQERVRDIRATSATWWWWFPIFPSTCKFPFLQVFWFFSWAGSFIPSIICHFPLLIISMAHFSKPNSILLKLVDKFTYLGSSISSTEKDINTRLTKAWTAIDKLSIIWKSDLTNKMKRSFFHAAVVSILLYGCTTWTLTKWLEKKLDGNYTRILRAIMNKSWRQPSKRHQLYGHLPHITKTIQARRTRHAGPCWRSRTLLEKQGQARKWCTPMDPHIWPGKSRMTSSNIHSAAMRGYRM